MMELVFFMTIGLLAFGIYSIIQLLKDYIKQTVKDEVAKQK